MSEKNTDNGIIKEKAVIISKTNCIIDTKTRTIIIEYYKQEILSKIYHLRTVKE